MSLTPPDPPQPPSPGPGWGPPQQPGPPTPGGAPGWGAPQPGPGYPPGPGQPPGGPAWGQAPGPGPGPGAGWPGAAPPAKRSPVVPLLIGVIVLIAVGAGAYVLLAGDDSGGGPEAAVRDFFQAVKDNDCQAIVGSVSSASFTATEVTPDEAVQECEAEGGIPVDGVELVSITVSNESDTNATVSMELTAAGQTESGDVTVVKEEGDWKIDMTSFLIAASGSGSTDTTEPGVTTTAPATTTTPTTAVDPGGGSAVSTLLPACEGGDMAACDDLYFATGFGTPEEAVAMSCGGRDPSTEHRGDCEETFG